MILPGSSESRQWYDQHGKYDQISESPQWHRMIFNPHDVLKLSGMFPINPCILSPTNYAGLIPSTGYVGSSYEHDHMHLLFTCLFSHASDWIGLSISLT